MQLCSTVTSIYPAVSDTGNHVNLGYRFLAETKRLWESSGHERRNLTSVQTAMTVTIIYNLDGLNKLSSPYGFESLSLAKEMRLFDGNANITSERERHARNFTAWCLFNIDRCVAFMLVLLLIIKVDNRTSVILAFISSARLFSPFIEEYAS